MVPSIVWSFNGRRFWRHFFTEGQRFTCSRNAFVCARVFTFKVFTSFLGGITLLALQLIDLIVLPKPLPFGNISRLIGESFCASVRVACTLSVPLYYSEFVVPKKSIVICLDQSPPAINARHIDCCCSRWLLLKHIFVLPKRVYTRSFMWRQEWSTVPR